MFVHVNAATSLDGKLATRERKQIAISGSDDFARVDRLREEVDAIAVGRGTVEADDPRLAVDGDDTANLVRVVFDSRAQTPTDARILTGDQPTYIITARNPPVDRVEALEHAGAQVRETSGTTHVRLTEALAMLEQEGIEHLLVEGGGDLLYGFFKEELVDSISVFISSAIIGGANAPTLVDGTGFVEQFPRLVLKTVDRVDTGVLCEYTVDGWSESPAG